MVKKSINRVDGGIYAIKIMTGADSKNINEVKALASISRFECQNVVRYYHSWV